MELPSIKSAPVPPEFPAEQEIRETHGGQPELLLSVQLSFKFYSMKMRNYQRWRPDLEL